MIKWAQLSAVEATSLKSIFTPTSLQAEQTEEPSEMQRQRGKRGRKPMKSDKPAVDTAPVPTKEYLAEQGSEHIYHTHACPKCQRRFKMHSHLQEHLRSHFPDPNLQCPTCKHYFSSKSKLRIHRLREAGEKLHQCHLCEYSAVERNAVRRHLLSVHAEEAGDILSNQIYPCPTCGRRFHHSRLLKAHMKTHNIQSETEKLVCFQQGCTFQTSSPKELLQHTAEVHRFKAVECRHHACAAVFQTQEDMKAHYQTHLPYHCSKCDFCCSNKAAFFRHQRHGHPGNDKLRCDFCSFTTFNPVEFEQHLGHFHANEKIHRCSQCSYVTSHKRGLKRHTLIHSGEKPHKCSVCDFRCRDVSYLSKHMLTHSDDKNFMCTECGYVTKWKHSLNVHMRKHAGDLRHQCDQCPYRSHRMDQLNSHKLRHQAKTLMCEICAFACKRKYELHSHMLTKHSGADKQLAALKCRYCSYTTSYRQALQNHENCKHTKLKEYRCALCPYSCFSNISLFLHKRKVHGYIPGDKVWLENYTAKEKERNSAEFIQGFYQKSLSTVEQFKQSTSKGLLSSHKEHSELPDSADPGVNKERASDSQLDSVDVSNVVSQQVVSEDTSGNTPSVDGPEEFCTLVLTTFSASSLQTEDGNCTRTTPSSSSFNCNYYKISDQKADLSMSLGQDDGTAMADAEGGQGDLDNTNEALTKTNQAETQVCHTSETDVHASSFFSLSEKNQPLESEIRLDAMKKHDKEQAENMVLEGRVQMLVVQNKDSYHRSNGSHVPRSESALKYPCRALCHARIKEHKCQACGALFKQKRGLDTHRAKKCSELGRTRTFSSPKKICTDSNDRECDHEGADRAKNAALQSAYVKEGGKFKCNSCKFSSATIASAERHLLLCRKIENPVISEGDEDRRSESAQSKKVMEEKRAPKVLVKHQKLSCPNCAFKCYRKKALESHAERGCLKLDEIKCSLCSFVAKSKMSLKHHILQVHNKKKCGEAKPKRLHCQHCSFTCKQKRCMSLHVGVKHKGARPYRCQYCCFSTTRRYRLQQHESLHTGIGRHGCSMCDKTFGTLTKLRQHKVRVHDKQPTHFCSVCDFSGYTPDDVRRHNFRCHSGELKHPCSHCNGKFSSELALKYHCKRAHQLQGSFPCKHCDYTCSSVATLRTHQESQHPQTRSQESFKTKESLVVYQRSTLAHHCQLCPFATKTRKLLAQHLLSEHEEGPSEEKPLKCSTCMFVCRHQLVLEQHLRSHRGKRLYKCTDCEYATRNKQKITWHIRIHTGEKPYSCELCSYTCADPSRLKLHMRVHKEEKKYLCTLCGYKCKWATQLKYHMTKHTGEKPYACDECDYRTNRADALRAHRDTQHSEARPYVCEKCGKTFKTSFILKTHQHQHSNDRPYVCGLCHKAFRWPAGLRHHFLSHTKQQPFCCGHCSYRAKQKFQVVKHLKRHHPYMSVEQGVVRDSEAVSLTLKEALQGTLDGKAAGVEEPDGSAEEEGAEEVMKIMPDIGTKC